MTNTSTGTVVVTGRRGTKVEITASTLGELERAITSTTRVLRWHEGDPTHDDAQEATDGS